LRGVFLRFLNTLYKFTLYRLVWPYLPISVAFDATFLCFWPTICWSCILKATL